MTRRRVWLHCDRRASQQLSGKERCHACVILGHTVPTLRQQPNTAKQSLLPGTMAAGLKSAYMTLLSLSYSLYSSCYSSLFRTCCGILVDHIVLCTMAQLAAASRRFVSDYISLFTAL